MRTFPDRHALGDVSLNVLGHMLKKRGRRSAASRARGDLRSEVADSQRLQNLLRNLNLLGAIAAWSRRQRDANRVTDAFSKQNRERSRARDDSLAAQPG